MQRLDVRRSSKCVVQRSILEWYGARSYSAFHALWSYRSVMASRGDHQWRPRASQYDTSLLSLTSAHIRNRQGCGQNRVSSLLHERKYLGGAAQLRRARGKGRIPQPGVETSRNGANDEWENGSFVARFLPLNGGMEAVLLTLCWKVLHTWVCIYRVSEHPSFSLLSDSSLPTNFPLLIDILNRCHQSLDLTTTATARKDSLKGKA